MSLSACRFSSLWLIGASALLSGCGGNLQWYVVSPMTEAGRANLLFLAGGLKYTLLLSITAIVISIVVGLLVALPGLSKNRWLRGVNRVYVEVVRAVPILVLILWVYYGLPIVMGLAVSVIGMEELTRRANELVTSQYRPLEIYTVLIIEYLLLILLVSAAVRWFERRLARRDAR